MDSFSQENYDDDEEYTPLELQEPLSRASDSVDNQFSAPHNTLESPPIRERIAIPNYDSNFQYGNLKRKLDKYKDYPLSDADIRQLMGNRCNIVRYRDIKKYNSIKQLLGTYECCFILYEWQERSGHWCLLTKSKNEVEFFDPYSGIPDSELDQVPEDKRIELGENHPYLSDLLRNCKYEICYNEFQFQKLDKGIKTCGRWCCLRCLLKDMNLYDFQKFFQGMYGDSVVTSLTSS